MSTFGIPHVRISRSLGFNMDNTWIGTTVANPVRMADMRDSQDSSCKRYFRTAFAYSRRLSHLKKMKAYKSERKHTEFPFVIELVVKAGS